MKTATKIAMITGVTGQDGSYLAEFLLNKGYEVHGVVRRASVFNTHRIEHLIDHKYLEDGNPGDPRFHLHYGDLTDSSGLNRLLRKIRPNEIYNLAAQSHVRVSFDIPEYTANVTGVGTIRLLDAILDSGMRPRFYQASSSEMYGKVIEVPQTESTPFYPRSPYGCAKVFSYWITVNYREAYDLHACNGILFNHESPRRGETFVTRKITRALARILAGKQKDLFLGNLDAKRDWGYAGDYVEAMWLMLQAKEAEDYVIATGEAHSVREFLSLAFDLVNLNWQDYVKIDKTYYRPTEVEHLVGDATKARNKLGWKPKVTFSGLVRSMVEADLITEGLDPQKYIKNALNRRTISRDEERPIRL